MAAEWTAGHLGARSFVATVGPFQLVVMYSPEWGGWRAEAHFVSTIRQAPEPLDTSDQAKTVAVELASMWIDDWCNDLYELVPVPVLH
jgi:hypothetical protein